MKKEKKANQRLSLQDFKLKAIDSKKELEKLLGGAAESCHKITVDPSGDSDSTFD